MVVRDQTDESTVYINIPANADIDDIELNEEQLEAAAGGFISPSSMQKISSAIQEILSYQREG